MEKEMKPLKTRNQKYISGVIKLMFAVFLAIGSVVYIMYRGASNKAYREKWQDYDECGLG